MLFLTHLLLGVLIALVAGDFISGGSYLVFFLLVLLGSLLPDIDESRSKMVRLSGVVGMAVSFFSKHRGFFHSLAFVVLVTLISRLFLGYYYAWALFLGLVGHLLADAATRKGVNLFYPFFDLKMKGWVKVSSWEETMIQVLLVLLIVWKIV